jgi:hypothetical protein
VTSYYHSRRRLILQHTADPVMANDKSAFRTRAFRPLLPLAPPSQQPRPPAITQQNAQNPLRKRRVAVPIACDSCRGSKTKCSGVRPSCRRCAQQHLKCHYSADTSFKALERDYGKLQDVVFTQGKILEWLAILPDSEAQRILRMIRSGMPIEIICSQFMAGEALMQLAVTPTTCL